MESTKLSYLLQVLSPEEFVNKVIGDTSLLDEIKSCDDDISIQSMITKMGKDLVDKDHFYRYFALPLSLNTSIKRETSDLYLRVMGESQYGLIPKLVRNLGSNPRFNQKKLNRLLDRLGEDLSADGTKFLLNQFSRL